MPKTQKQKLEDLKKNWLNDPTWNIEDAKGFEEYRDELLLWRTSMEIRHAQEAEDELIEKTAILKARYDNDPWRAIIDMEQKIKKMQRIIESFIDDGK